MNRKAMDIGETLRSGDPAHGAAFEPVEVAELRERLRAALEPPPAAAWPWRAIVAGLALTVLAVVLGRRTPEAPAPAFSAGAPRPPAARNVKEQQLHFETPDGTRIVWVLSPDTPL